MRFEQYINEKSYNNFHGLLLVCDATNLNESDDKVFKVIKSAGDKLGLRVVRSNTLVGLFKVYSKDFKLLVQYAAEYLLTDIKDSKSRSDIVKKAKKISNKINRKDMLSFLMQFDKLTLGITSHIRHIFQSVFGIQIDSYNNWLDNYNYILSEIDKIRAVLKKMGNSDKELKILDQFEKNIKLIEA